MSDIDDLKERYRGAVNAGSEAESIITSKIFQDAFASIKNNIMKDFLETPFDPSNDGFRMRCQVALQTLDEIQRYLEIAIRDGTMAVEGLKSLDENTGGGIL